MEKFWIGFVPLAVFAVVLVVLTNRLLGVPPASPRRFIAGLLVGLVAAIVAMGLAFGAALSAARHANAAQIATGFGAIVYMAASLGLIVRWSSRSRRGRSGGSCASSATA